MKRESKMGNTIIFLVLLIGAVVMIAPLLWMISTSLKDKSGVFSLPPQWIPDPFITDAYKRLFELEQLWTGVKNSIIVSFSVTIVGTITSSLAAFSFAKLRLPFKNMVFLLLLK